MPPFEYKYIKNDNKETLIFFNGFRIEYKTWKSIYSELEKEYSLALFNRRGVGKSQKASSEQDAKNVVREIHEFILALNVQPPYTLVAHSLGGVFANMYARSYPEEIKSVIFVESSNPDEIIEQKKFHQPLVLNLLNKGIKKIEKLFDPLRYSEDEVIAQSISQINSANEFPNIPVVVITGVKNMPFVPKEPFNIHLKYQEKLLELSDNSKQYFCSKSGHFPQITEPKKVVEIIKSVC